MIFYGFTSVEFFQTYMTKWIQRVCVNNVLSDVAYVISCILQGSVLGPFLFLVHINDLPINIGCDSILYVDDTTKYIMRNNRELGALGSVMADAQAESQYWFEANGITLNKSKTQSLLFTLCRTQTDIDECESAKLLGVVLDSTLNWELHIQNVCTRLSRVVCLLRHLRNLLPNNILRNSYFAFFIVFCCMVSIYGVIALMLKGF